MKVIYWLAAHEAEAREIASALLEQKLVACVNIMPPCTSLYEWEGVMEEGTEVAVFCKASSTTADGAVSFIADNHSYDCPAIMVWPVEAGHEPYMRWVNDQCGR